MGKVHVAVDIGGSGVKLTAAKLEHDRIVHLEEKTVPNKPLRLQGHLFIDIYGLYGTIKNTLAGICADGLEPVSLGIDTYGNGYGLLDGDGSLIGLPYFYKDSRTQGALEALDRALPLEELYRETGVFPTDIRVLVQLFYERREEMRRLFDAKQLLLFPDLLGYFFTGQCLSERSMASVAGLLRADCADWCGDVLERLDIPAALFGQLVDGGDRAGIPVHGSVQHEIRSSGLQYIPVTSHDTESALLAAPGLARDVLFASLGTSVIFGARTEAPVISEQGYRGRFKNMHGAFGANSLCRDYNGLWLIEQCIAHWRWERPGLTYDEVDAACLHARENNSWFDVSAPEIRFSADPLPVAVQRYCADTGQAVPQTMGEIANCVLESIALEMKWSFAALRALTGRQYRALSVVGGGGRNPVFVQMMADALELPVWVGSAYAATMGNVLMQMYACGELDSPGQMGEVARNTCEVRIVEPRSGRDKWISALKRLQQYKEKL